MKQRTLLGVAIIAVAVFLLAVNMPGRSRSDVQPQATITPTCFNYLPVLLKNYPPPTATPSAPCLCDRDRYNCSDFSTQAQAQTCYNYCIAQGAGDIHRLDQDHDGIACESLP